MPKRRREPFQQLSSCSQNSISSQSFEDAEDSSEKRAGTINRIVLKNFMCHSLLEVNFANNVTFVIGKNGSGKSAILTALILVLGGKASLTNRGKNVKGFVKVGKTSGSVEIELSNEGPMAYRPDDYGKAIIVIRNFSVNGSSSYRIKSQTGSVIATQAKELYNITLALNIQVNNPVCILNQDISRNFLNSNDPKNKFSLFMKATKLETLKAEYQIAQTNREDCVRLMNDKKEHFNKLKDEIRRLERHIESHRSIISFKDKKMLLQRELLWAQVRDIEEEVQVLVKNLQIVEEKLNNCKSNSKKRVENVSDFNNEIKELEQKILEITGQIQVQKRSQFEKKNQLDELKSKLSSKMIHKQQLLTSIQNQESDLETIQETIESSKKKVSDLEQQKIERATQLESLRNKIQVSDNQLETSKNDLFQIKSDLSRKEEEEKHLKNEISDVTQSIIREKSKLEAISVESGNKLHLYGKDISKIKAMIQQYKDRFHQEPRGPLGTYIKIKDKKWSLAVEGHLGGRTLCAFVVDNKHDNRLLREIFNKFLGPNDHPEIMTSKFIYKKHNVKKNLVAEPNGCVSIYNIIQIADPIVSNVIVDTKKIEHVLLIPSEEQAQQLLSDRQNVPMNCRHGMTLTGDIYYPDPDYRTYASTTRRAQYLEVDTKDYIIELRQNIEKLTRRKEMITEQLQAFRNSMKEQINTKTSLENKIKKITQIRGQIRNQLEELYSTMEPASQNLKFLEQELEETRQAVNLKRVELEKNQEEVKKIKQDLQESEAEYSTLKNSTTSFENRVQSINDEIKEKKAKQREINTSNEFEKKRIQEYENRVKKAQSELTSKQKELDAGTKEASGIGERLDILRDVNSVIQEITDISHRIAKIETNTENINDVINKHDELKDKYRSSADILKSLQQSIEELSIALQKREMHYKLTENYFITFTKLSFKQVLKMRQFEGDLDINIKEGKLELVVVPQQGSQGHTSVSNLSGGERSFSTVAFLFSLWQCTDLPFYFLDEFDVYMDKLNRTKIIEVLIHYAKTKPSFQYVFFTPQDISFINQDVSILRLEDPER